MTIYPRKHPPVVGSAVAFAAVCFGIQTSALHAAPQTQAVADGTAISAHVVVPGSNSRSAIDVEFLGGPVGGSDAYWILRDAGTVDYFGARSGFENRAPVAPLAQVVGGAVGRRADGTIVSWSGGPYVPPSGGFIDVASLGGNAAIRTDGRMFTWGFFEVSVPFTDAGPFVDVEVTPRAVVARRSDGTLTSWGVASAFPAGSYAEHKLAYAAGLNIGVARRLDGTLAVIGPVSTPEAFRLRAYGRCLAGPRNIAAIDANGALWVAGDAAAERRYEGPFVDAAIGSRSFLALRPDGSVVKQSAAETGPGSTEQNLAFGATGPRFELTALDDTVVVAVAGSLATGTRRSTFALSGSGVLRVIDGAPWPGMNSDAGGVIARDIVAVYPFLLWSGAGGGILVRARNGALTGFAAYPPGSDQSALGGYHAPAGFFSEFIGETKSAAGRMMFGIDVNGDLVSWNPTIARPRASVEVAQCLIAAGQYQSTQSGLGGAIVLAYSLAEGWQCFGDGNGTLCVPSGPPVDGMRLLATGQQGALNGPAFARDASAAILTWGSPQLAGGAPVGPVKKFGIVDRGAGQLSGCLIRPEGGFEAWGVDATAMSFWSLNDPSFSANDIVQTMSQCTVRVGAGDCDADGVLDWDEIVSAGAAGDCNDNGIPDSCDIAAGEPDADGDGVPDACARAAVGDLNGDGRVNGPDIAILLSAWGGGKPGAADLNGDGSVNGADLALLLSNWTD